MANQYVWVGVTVGVFVAGIGIGFAALQAMTAEPGPMSFGNMSPEQAQQAMQDPDFRQKMMNEFRNNPQHMNQMMGQMMETMIGDPQMRQQMMDMMLQHPEMMSSMGQHKPMMRQYDGSRHDDEQGK